MPNPIVHFEINSQEPKKLQEFYKDTFGWHIDDNNPMNYGMVDTHAGGIGGGIAEGDNQVTIYIEVDDPQKYLDQIKAKGGKVVHEVEEIPNMVTFALFADPSGNVMGLVKAQPQ